MTEDSLNMSFDIAKTETFVPFLWIISKTVVVVGLFGLFSNDVRNWTAGADGKTVDPGVVMSAEFSDRLIAVLILMLVLCERGMDLYVVSRSDVTQKVTRKTFTGLNTHIITDVFVGFCLLHSVKTRTYECTQRYWLTTTSCLWFMLGLSVFVFETHLKRKVLHHEHDKTQRDAPKPGNIVDYLHSVRPVLLYVGMVFLMSVSVTSLCLHLVYSEMLHVEFCFRLLLYASYVCCRCYTQGMPGDSIVDEIPNLALFGWILLLPVALLYVGVSFSIAAYARLLSTPARKNTTILPVAATHASAALTSSAPAYVVSHVQQPDDPSRLKVGDRNAEFLAQLQNIEQSMSLTNNTPAAKSSHTAKRRPMPLF